VLQLSQRLDFRNSEKKKIGFFFFFSFLLFWGKFHKQTLHVFSCLFLVTPKQSKAQRLKESKVKPNLHLPLKQRSSFDESKAKTQLGVSLSSKAEASMNPKSQNPTRYLPLKQSPSFDESKAKTQLGISLASKAQAWMNPRAKTQASLSQAKPKL
jgi:glutaredoxin-related protein